jgi:hypothetical protein
MDLQKSQLRGPPCATGLMHHSRVPPLARSLPVVAVMTVVAMVPMMAIVPVVAGVRLLDEACVAAVDAGVALRQ